ncbi:hypothetical protein CSAL01_10426 [Colletotrichum salicis]|uniref:Uncharacterized protein n=1 Tax=Colletotrichum salicis TaxID=1209931 RepID=A0A135V0M0_9PEZI|nr:hypothetical protein CSAL01_10426 [Colletotrichum salicis]
MVQKLETLIPGARQRRSNAKLPWELYMNTILARGPYYVSPAVEVLEYLVQPLVTYSNPLEASKVWAYFASRTLQSEDLTPKYVNEAARCLIRTGIFNSYEKYRLNSALLPIAEAFSNKWLLDSHIAKNFSVTDDTLCFLLKTTSYWNSFKESLCGVELLKVSATLNHSMAVDQLLTQGISVLRRYKGVSAPEHVCALPATHEEDTSRVRQLLEYADSMFLNHTNPKSGLGLIHLTNEADVPQFRYKLVEMLLGCGVSPDLRIRIWPRPSALVYHLSRNRVDLAAILLRLGADPTVPTRNAAYREIDWECQVDIDHNFQTYKGIRPPHNAALYSVDCLQATLENVTSLNLEAPAKNGYTTIQFAVMSGNISAIDLLHDRGANIIARSIDGKLAQHIAVGRGNLATVERLLELGSEMTPDCEGLTPLLLAYQRNNQEIIKCLRAHDVGQHAVVSAGVRSTALAKAGFRATKAENLSSCQELLWQVSTVDIDIPSEGCTALGVAVSSGELEIITWLLQQGANANYPCANGNSIIGSMIGQYCLNPGLQAMLEKYVAAGGSVLTESDCLVATAVDENNEEGLTILLDHIKAHRKLYAEQVGVGSSAVLALAVNRKWQGKTPLLRAANMDNGSVRIDQLLIDNDADLEAKDDDWGCTLLGILAMASATDDDSDIVRALLQAGSNINCRDKDGATPIAEACSRGNPYSIAALMKRGSNVLVRDYQGRNLLHRLLRHSGSDEEGDSNLPALFFKLTLMGVDPCEVDMFGCSALQLGIQSKCMTTFLLNGDIHIHDKRPIPWSLMFFDRYPTDAACLTTAFPLYRRKLTTETFRELLSLKAIGIWNPLCFAASAGQIQIMENILSLGIPIDLEGCPEGSALMAASSAGTLESVIYLVRHGASISFQGQNDFRSAVKLAATAPRVLRWLLVDRFTDQKKLDHCWYDSTSLSAKYRPWSGVQKAEMIISGQWERQPHESSRQYWARLLSMIE